MDYLAYYFNAMAFCGAVETLTEVEVPKRAQYLRVIHLELNRIMSHLVWLGNSMIDLVEDSIRQQLHTRYIQVGGVMEDIPAGWEAKLREFIAEMPGRVDQYL